MIIPVDSVSASVGSEVEGAQDGAVEELPGHDGNVGGATNETMDGPLADIVACGIPVQSSSVPSPLAWCSFRVLVSMHQLPLLLVVLFSRLLAALSLIRLRTPKLKPQNWFAKKSSRVS